MLVAGSAIGYVWQKNEIDRLGSVRVDYEKRLEKLNAENKTLADQLASLHNPVMLDQRVRELNLGMAPAQPMQVTRLPDPVMTLPSVGMPVRQFAQRPLETTGQ